MKRLLLLAAFLSAPAMAQSNLFFKTESMALTGVAPTLPSDGVDVSAAQGLSAVLLAPSAQTITGGSVVAYAYMCSVATAAGGCTTKAWVPYALGAWTPITSVNAAPSGDFEVLSGVFRLAFRSSAVTVSSGSVVTITYTVRNRK